MTSFRLQLLLLVLSMQHIAAQDAAACGAACDDYNSEVEVNFQGFSEAVAYIGASFGSNAKIVIDGMCGRAGTSIQTCHVCSLSGPNGLSGQHQQLVDAWWQTCVTRNDNNKDDNAAYNCWLSIPSGSSQCPSDARAASLGGGGSAPVVSSSVTMMSSSYASMSIYPSSTYASMSIYPSSSYVVSTPGPTPILNTGGKGTRSPDHMAASGTITWWTVLWSLVGILGI